MVVVHQVIADIRSIWMMALITGVAYARDYHHAMIVTYNSYIIIIQHGSMQYHVDRRAMAILHTYVINIDMYNAF